MIEKHPVEKAFDRWFGKEKPGERIFMFLPFSDLRGYVYEGEEFLEAIRSFPLERLNGIRALGFLTHISPDPKNQYFIEFNHTRFYHSLLVAKTMQTILRRNGMDDKENIGVAASLLHDIATPALGDAAKSVDPVNLDEEKFWRDVLDDKSWMYLRGIVADSAMLDSIIKNEGVLGQVLDVADRIAYVCRDLYTFSNDPGVKEILEANSDIGNIYRDVFIEDGQIYFNDPERLRKFLLLRVIITKNLYMHPINQARDLKFAKFLSSYYSASDSDTDKLTPSILRRMTDNEALEWLAQKSGHPDAKTFPFMLFADFIRWQPKHIEKFDNLARLEKRENKLKENPKIKIIGVKVSNGFNPGTAYKVKGNKGEIVEFREFDPEGALEIEKIAESTAGVFLFYDSDKVDNT